MKNGSEKFKTDFSWHEFIDSDRLLRDFVLFPSHSSAFFSY